MLKLWCYVDHSMQILIIFVLFIFPCLRAQLLAPHLRGGVPHGALADGLAVCAQEVLLGRLDIADLGGGSGNLLHHHGFAGLILI